MQFATILAVVDKPDVYVMLNNVASTFSYLTLYLRYFLIILSLFWMVFALFNLWSVSVAGGGQPNKLLPSKAQPTMAGAWMQAIVAGLLFIMAYKMLPAALMSSLITGDVIGVEIYSVGTYAPGTVDNAAIRSLIQDVIGTLMQFIGWLAYFRGFNIWYQMGQGTTEHRASRVIGYFFFGSLCMAFMWVNSLIANTLGFDLFGFFMQNKHLALIAPSACVYIYVRQL